MRFEFDLQRFDEEGEEATSADVSEEESQEEKPPIPEELGGLDEEYARAAMSEWQESQPEEKPKSAPAPISQEDYQSKIDEVEKLKAELANYKRQESSKPQEQTTSPQFQPPQMKITPEISEKINQAIRAEAMNMSGFSEDDVASLDYADEDDPRIAQWQQAKNIAQINVLGALRQAQMARYQQEQFQKQQEEKFQADRTAAMTIYNEFAQKEFKEPDYKGIVDFATNEFFERFPPKEQEIIAQSYENLGKQTATPAEMLLIKQYYERAKAVYRGRYGAKNNSSRQAQKLPRVDQLGGYGTIKDGQLSAADIEKMLAGDFTKLDAKTRNYLMGFN